MRQLKFFFMLLLSLVGMSAMANVRMQAGSTTARYADAEESAEETPQDPLKNDYYFFKSGIGDKDVWMTSMRTIVALVEEARNFWSVWHIEYVEGSDNLYTFRNVGNQYVMTPTTDPEKKNLDTDDGYLYYDNGIYKVGKVENNSGKIKNMKLTKQDDGSYLIQPEGKSNSNYYMAIDKFSGGYDESGNALKSDHSLKSISTDDKEKRSWTFVKVEESDVKGKEAQEGQEAPKGLYEQGVQDLNSYVGGLTTMDIPDSDDDYLKPIRDVIDRYKNDKAELTGEVVDAAEKYQNYIQAINAMRVGEGQTKDFCQELVEGRPFWIETIGSRSGYKWRMIVNNEGKWANAEEVTKTTAAGTFYVEPTAKEGSVIDPITGTSIPYSTYYVMRNGEDKYLYTPEQAYYNGTSITDRKYDDWSKDSHYLSSYPHFTHVTHTLVKDDALKFTILPIIPGVYQMSHIEEGWQGDPYLTFGGGNVIESYRRAESYSYFKFKTYNTYEYLVQKVGTENVDQEFVGTYGNGLHSEINENDIKAYYIRAGKYAYHNEEGEKKNTVDETKLVEDKGKKETPREQMDEDYDWGIKWEKNNEGVYTSTMTVYLDQIPKDQGSNIIQGRQGVILKGEKTHGTKKEPAPCKIYDGTIKPGSQQDLLDNNMLKVALTDIIITDDTWGNYYDYFVLAYKSKDGDPVGYWHQQPVKGVGLGFYHVKRGERIPAGKCFLHRDDLEYQLQKRYDGSDGKDKWNQKYLIPWPETKDENNTEATSNSRSAAPVEGDDNVATGIRLVFRDCNGVITGIEEAPIIDIEEDELEALTTLYSLDGKKVSAPKSGEIYILNGKKVMF